MTALVLGMEEEGEDAATDGDDEEWCSVSSSSSPRLFRCSPGGMKEDCLYCAAGREQDAVQNAIAKEYDRLLQQNSSTGEPLAPSEVVERLVEAVQEGLGYDGRQKSEAPLLDVWVFRRRRRKRSEGANSKAVDSDSIICFTGVGDDESFDKVKAFLNSRQQRESEQQ